jgi:oligosaccharide repeat unit polymerase
MSIDPYRLTRKILLLQAPPQPKLSRTFVVAFIVFLCGLFTLYVAIDGRINRLYSAIHFLIIGISLAHILWVRRFNLGASYSLFAMFFFGVIPLFEYRLGVTYSGANTPSDDSYATAAWLAVLSSVCFYVGYGLKRGTAVRVDALKKLKFVSVRHRQIALWTSLVTLLAMAVFIVIFYDYSLGNLLLRGFGEEQEKSAMGNSFITYFARPMFLNLVFIMMLSTARHRHVSLATMFVLWLGAVIFVSPIGIPRSLAGALYIPMLMMVFVPKYYSKYSLLCVILFAVLLAAPVADVFRTITHQDTSVDLGENFSMDYMFSGHFDAFHNLAQVVDLHYASEGWQVIGILLFWVPRGLWTGKPLSTSFDFADFAGFRAHNISFTLPAEFYVDYGVGGIIVGMFLVGLIYRRLDNLFSRQHPPGSVASYVFAIGHLELSILGLYLIRGSVLSSFAYTVGLASTLFIIRAVERLMRIRCFRLRSRASAAT